MLNANKNKEISRFNRKQGVERGKIHRNITDRNNKSRNRVILRQTRLSNYGPALNLSAMRILSALLRAKMTARAKHEVGTRKRKAPQSQETQAIPRNALIAALQAYDSANCIGVAQSSIRVRASPSAP